MPVYNFLLSFFIEFGPATAFLFVAIYFDFFTGVKVLMIMTVLTTVLSLWRDGRIPKFTLISAFFVLISGALTLFFNNAYFTVLEFTLYNLIFGVAGIVGYFRDKPLMKSLFGTMFSITDRGWHILSLRWSLFFILAAIGNEIFWHFYGQDVWIYYRLITTIILTIFGFSQFFLSRKERLPDASPWGLCIYK